MYYSSGNYEAFARPRKPEGVDQKSAYIIGSGLAASDGRLLSGPRRTDEGRAHSHLWRRTQLPGGACDGWKFENVGYVMRGGREMDNHFEVMWDLFHSIPSIETEGVSVLDEYYWLNKADPNYSLCRATVNRGRGRPHRRQVRHLRQGRDGDHEAVLHARTSSFRTSASPTSSTTRCSTPTSGSTGAPCSPSRTGTARWR